MTLNYGCYKAIQLQATGQGNYGDDAVTKTWWVRFEVVQHIGMQMIVMNIVNDGCQTNSSRGSGHHLPK